MPDTARTGGYSTGAGFSLAEKTSVAEAAEILRTSQRFPRRLIQERRIGFIHVGRHVRIPESALREFIAAGLNLPINTKGK
jgi:excisionase family DNA binding protein